MIKKLTKLQIMSVVSIAVLLLISAVAAVVMWDNTKLPAVSTPVTSTDLHDYVSPSDTASDNVSSEEAQPTQTAQPTQITKLEKYVRITEGVRVRSDDSSSSKQLSQLAKGAEVKYISESSERYQVEYAPDKKGWIVKSCGELFDKLITINLLPEYVSGAPVDMSGTNVGDSLSSIFRNRGTVGASVAVIENGKVAYHFEYGYADKSTKTKVAENTKFRIASVTKVFTGMMSMRQAEDGVLDLDKDLSKIMGFTVRNPNYKKIAITQRMLLTHTAGMKDGNPVFEGDIRTQLARKDHYNSKPGTKFLYSNFGMGIAGAVIEKCANQTLAEYARDKFFVPMGLDASFDAKYLSDKSLVANCYNGSTLAKDNKYLTRSQPWGGPGETFHLGAGGLLISAEDLASLTTILINGGTYNGQQYLSEKSVSEMLSKQLDTSNFTQCIAIRKKEKLVGERTMYYHNGEAYGIHSLMVFDLTDKSGVIVITSGASAVRNDNTVFAVCDEIMNLCYSEIIDK